MKHEMHDHYQDGLTVIQLCMYLEPDSCPYELQLMLGWLCMQAGTYDPKPCLLSDAVEACNCRHRHGAELKSCRACSAASSLAGSAH